MIKFAILMGILCLSSFVGFEMSKTYKEKLMLYEDILSFCKTLKNEISFLKTDILTIINREQYKSHFGQILSDFSDKTKDKDSFDKEQIGNLLNKYKILTEQDKNLLTAFLYSLGKLSYEEQIASLEYYINIFDDLIKKQSENNKKMVPLCNKMGILIGLVICIVLF